MIILLTIILICITFTLVCSNTIFRVRSIMYVCLCKGITDTQIRAAVEDGAISIKEVNRTLGVASQCGKCGILARDIVRESLADLADNNEQLFYALS